MLENKIKVLLINPPENTQGNFYGPPLGLLYLAGYLLQHNNVEVEIIDGCLETEQAIEKKIIDFKPAYIGITCLTPGRQKALAMATIAKNINGNIVTIIGGVHPTIMFKQILENYPKVDLCILGEGEKTLWEIIQGKPREEIDGIAFLKDGKVVRTKPRTYVKNLDELPFPAWQLIELKKYKARGHGVYNGIDLNREIRVPIIFSRGCVGQCAFCSTWWIWRGWRRRSPQNMVDEIELIQKKYGFSHFVFSDDALTVDRQATIDLCQEIIRRGLKIAFHVTTRTDLVDEEMLGYLKQAGCYEIAYGIETASAKLLEKMNKKNDLKTAKRAIQITKQAGIMTNALMIAGNQGETEETINQSVDFLNETNPDDTGVGGGLWILPGTKLYYDCLKNNYIKESFWLSDRPYKIYCAEHWQITLNFYSRAIKNRKKISKYKIINIIKELLIIIKIYAGKLKKIIG